MHILHLTGMLAWGRTRVKTGWLTLLFRRARWPVAAAWMGGIFYLSHQSAPYGVTVSSGGSAIAHISLYLALAVLLFWALAGGLADRMATPDWVLASIAFGLTALYGVSDEVHQAFVSGRTASEADVGLDMVGAAIGVTLALLGERIQVLGHICG